MTAINTVDVPLPAPAARATTANESIRPFRFSASDEELADLRRRILATRWPEKEPVADFSQGVPLATMQKLARYWTTEYDWRKVEAKLNNYPQFITNIDGRSEEHTSELQSQSNLVCRLLLEKKKKKKYIFNTLHTNI